MKHVEWLKAALAAARSGKTVRMYHKCGYFFDDFKPTEFIGWFERRLDRKISGLTAVPTEQELSWETDLRTVADYYNRRIRRSGCSGLLRTAKAQRLWPNVNRQAWED